MSIWIQISAGTGPVECCEFVYRFTNYFKNILQKNDIKVEAIITEPGPKPNTYTSVIFTVDKLLPFLRKEYEGTLKWISKSSFRPSHKRKNWYITVKFLEEPEHILYNLNDVRVETLKAGGPGGQHQNKTESAVRITHIPTNISIVAREERSQHQNKRLAYARLAEKLKTLKHTKHNTFHSECFAVHHSLIRGNEIKTFKGDDFQLN